MSSRTRDFIAYLGSMGVRLYLEEDRLRCKAPAGVLTAEMREELRVRKTEIRDLLAEEESRGAYPQPLHARFEHQAASTPHAPALYFRDARENKINMLDYEWLNRKANRWAHALIAAGVTPETRVAVCLPPAVDAIIALFAILKAGAVFVALDPADPPVFLATRIGACRPSFLLTRGSLARRFNEQPLRILIMDEGPADPANPENPSGRTSANAPAWLLPCYQDNVALSHETLGERLDFLRAHLPLHKGDRVLHHSPLAAETALAEMLLPMLSGAALWTASPDTDARSLPEIGAVWHDAEKIALLFMDGSRLGGWLASLERNSAEGGLSTRVVCAGAPLGETLLSRFHEFRAARLYFAYARPECGGILHLQRYQRGTDGRLMRRDISSDKPLLLLDGRLNPVPNEVRGEIVVGGFPEEERPRAAPHLRRGFLSRSHAGQPHQVLLRTGDWARLRSDGFLEWLGTEDRETSRHGYRLNPGRVEEVLLSCEDVRACRVMERETTDGRMDWLAFIVPRNRFQLARLRRFAEAYLPAHTWPTAYVAVSQIPLTAMGRVNQEALAKLEVIDSSLERRWAEWLAKRPGIRQAAVVTRSRPQHLARGHVSDMLVEEPSAEADTDTRQAARAPGKAPSGRSLPARGTPSLAAGEPLVTPENAPTTLAEVLERAAAQFSQNGLFYPRTDGSARAQSYAELSLEAYRILAGLRSLHLQSGDTVLFQLEQPWDFLPAFWACVLGGIVAVPVSVPPDYRSPSGALNLLRHAREMFDNPWILTTSEREPELESWVRGLGEALVRTADITRLRLFEPAGARHRGAVDGPALMLLTSGSTGRPKAVMQSHHALVYRSAATIQMNGFSDGDISLNWMPLDHVGGLVMFHLRDVYAGARQIHAPMEAVLSNPLLWLDWIQDFKATVTWAPNFAFGLINDRAEEVRRGRWDLSSMRFILNGGEAIVAKTARGFLNLLAPHGLSPNSMFPAWGMSETCSGVTYAHDFSPRTTRDDDPLVSVGRPIPGFAIRIASEHNQPVPEGLPGRLQVRGPSVSAGYYRNEALNQEVFTAEGWFDTGDRGMLRDGSLTITGREKDTIIINGINYHGHEIEAVVEEIRGVTVSFTAACAARTAGADTDQLALFFHTPLERETQRAELLHQIRDRVFEKTGVQPSFLLPVAKEAIPKTAIGKIQRSQLVNRLAQGEFTAVLKAADLLLENANTLPQWFYRPVWRRHEEESELSGRPPGAVLLLLDRTGLGACLLEKLGRRELVCIAVGAGADFAVIGRDRFEIDPRQPEHYQRLFALLSERGTAVSQVLHLWAYDPLAASAISGDERELEQRLQASQVPGPFSLLHLVHALNRGFPLGPAVEPKLYIITSQCLRVAPEDRLELEKATLPAFVKTIAREFPAWSVRLVDLGPGSLSQNGTLIQREMGLPTRLEEVAYRGGRRWIRRLERVRFHGARQQSTPLERGGFYLITGGLGGIGPLVARFLIDHYQARLLLVGRRALPARGDEPGSSPRQGEMRKTLKSLKTMAKHGDQIRYEPVDIGNPDELQEVVARAVTAFGREPDGIFHLAGDYHERTLLDEDMAGMWSVMRPKLLGTLNLNRLPRNRPTRALFYFSSIIGYFGGRGAAAYAAANSFLAHVAEELHAEGRPVFCFDWGPWREIGMSRGYFLEELFEARGYRSLTAPQAILSLRAGLHLGLPRLLVGLDETKPFVRGQVDGPARPLRQLAAFFTTGDDIAVDFTGGPSVGIRDRFGQESQCELLKIERMPLDDRGRVDLKRLAAMGGASQRLGTRRTPPRNETERRLAAIWLDLLPISEVGVEESFFQLGGHSLLATRVVSRILDDLAVTLSVRELFQAPTIAGLAQRIEAQSPREVNAEAAPRPRTRPTRIPLSFAQQRLWFLNRLEGPHAAYNIPFTLRVRGPLSATAFEMTMAAIVERHESLRTRFSEDEAGPHQIIEEKSDFQAGLVDLRSIGSMSGASGTMDGLIRHLAVLEAAHIFNLESGPPRRVTLLQCSGAETILLITMHHIISDGWSAGVLVEEFGKLYPFFSGATATAPAATLPPLPLQYADFAIWQRERHAVLRQQLAYWKSRLAGLPQRLELPTDRRRPAVQTYRAAAETVSLDADLTAALERFSLGRGATLFMTLLAGFQILLGRYSGSRDFAVGSPIANRTRRELEPLIGFFVNTLVLRANLSGNPSSEELLERVKETTLAAITHQEVPFERVVEALQPQRNLSHTPLFQVMFVLQNAPGGRLDLPDLTIRPMERTISATKFELTLRLTEIGGGLSGLLEYKIELFERETVCALWTHYQHLLRAMVDAPALAIERLPIPTRADRVSPLESWNQGENESGEPQPIFEWMQSMWERAPDAAAVFYGSGRAGIRGASLTRKQLRQDVDRLAGHLRARGVKPEDRIGILPRRSLEMVTARLAIMRAGAAFLPIDPVYPAARVGAILGDAEVSLLLTDRDPERAWGLPPDRVLNLRALAEPSGELAAGMAWPLREPDHSAYIIYTSGTTGRPKGVSVSRRALDHYVNAILARLRPEPGWEWASWSALSSDATHTGFFGALCSGGRLRVIPREQAQDPENSHQAAIPAPDIAHMVPALLDHLLDTADPCRFLPVRVLILGGDVVNWSSIRRVWALKPGGRILNHYGPTETTVACISGEVLPEWEPITAAVPIGRPHCHYRAYVLDRFLQPVPRGVTGELFIGGHGLARGYWNRADQTAASFPPDPFAGGGGARMYRTGDRARYLLEGNLVFLGRQDFQVKVRGYRVELEEIENQLLAHPAVTRAVVSMRPDRAGQMRLIAHLVTRAPLKANEPREFLKPNLPDYMLPSAFVFLEALPLTTTGKLDRAALPDPEPTDPADQGFSPPRGVTERALAAIWQEILEVPPPDRHANFFEMGGHSLLATRVISRIRARFGVELPVRVLFEAPSLAELAAKFDRAAGIPQLPMIAISAQRERKAFPLSFGQRRLWFLERLEGASAVYNMPLPLRLEGPLDRQALAAALEALKERHMVLRTTIAEEDGEPMQVVSASRGIDFPLVDLSALAMEAREKAEAALIDLEAERVFDPRKGPLFRVLLPCSAPESHILMLTQHHMISDGWSLGILIHELITLYNGFAVERSAAGSSSPLPELAYQYVDYVDWQMRLMESPELARQLRYWRQQLSGAPPLLELPTHKPRRHVRSHAGAGERFELGEDLSASLAALSRRAEATLFMTLLAAFQLLLSRYSGQRDVSVGTPIANRTRLELEPLIGFFANTLVLRTEVDSSASFESLLHQVRNNALDAYAHQDVPFEKVVEAVQPERDRSHTPLFQVMFAMRNNPGEAARPVGLRIAVMRREHQTAKFDLTLTLEEAPRGLSGFLQYNRMLYTPTAMRAMIENLRTLLEGIAADPGLPVGRLPILSPAERKRILKEGNLSGAELPEPLLLHRQVWRTAARLPEAAALVFNGMEGPDRQLTYGELARASLVLARRLLARGVRPEQPVGLCMERSPAMMIAILAILEAGAVYVPLEPDYPRARQRYMSECTAIEIILAHEKQRSLLDALGVQAMFVENFPLGEGSTTLANAAPMPAQIAYIIFTSGSSGRPKGVAITHGGITNRVAWSRRYLDFSAKDNMLQRTPLGFDASVWELFSPLQVGGRLVIAAPGRHGDTGYLIHLIQTRRVTVVQMVPSLLTVLLEHEDAARIGDARVLCCGGEAYPLETYNRIRGLGIGARLVNLYGPTEGTIDATAWSGLEAPEQAILPIGRPIAKTRCFVLDRWGEPVPVGVTGELHIAGMGLARGYWGRPALSAEKFIPNPFPPNPGERLYRCGDLVRRGEDGLIHYLGRTDLQFKLRGFRIEAGEIETQLERCAGVSQAVITPVTTPNGEQRLVAWLMPRPGAEPDAAGPRRSLGERLPEYMIPAFFAFVTEWPRLPNGKVDRAVLARRRLPEWNAASRGPTSPSTAPRELTEFRLLEPWREVLGLVDIGIHDNFFALGGHSLLAIRLLAAVKRLFGMELSPAVLFENPTVAGLARAIHQYEGKRPWSHLVLIQAGTDASAAPLYCIHPPAGTLLCYAPLVRSLNTARPVFGFQASGLEEGQAIIESIENMAAAYVELLRKKQPGGPHHLLGWSAAGLVAFEMARQLREAGEEVGYLGLIDTGLMARMPEKGDAGDDMAVLLRLWAKDLGISLDDFEDTDRGLARILVKAKAEGLVPPEYGLDQARRRIAVSGAHTRAARAYPSAPYHGRVFLYRAIDDRGLAALGPTLGWELYVPAGEHGLVRVEVPGDHGTVMEPPRVEALARAIAGHLLQTTTRHGRGGPVCQGRP